MNLHAAILADFLQVWLLSEQGLVMHVRTLDALRTNRHRVVEQLCRLERVASDLIFLLLISLLVERSVA